MKEFHVLPINDLIQHKESPDCECFPLKDGDYALFIHHAKDAREKYERQGAVSISKKWQVIELEK